MACRRPAPALRPVLTVTSLAGEVYGVAWEEGRLGRIAQLLRADGSRSGSAWYLSTLAERAGEAGVALWGMTDGLAPAEVRRILEAGTAS